MPLSKRENVKLGHYRTKGFALRLCVVGIIVRFTTCKALERDRPPSDNVVIAKLGEMLFTENITVLDRPVKIESLAVVPDCVQVGIAVVRSRNINTHPSLTWKDYGTSAEIPLKSGISWQFHKVPVDK